MKAAEYLSLALEHDLQSQLLRYMERYANSDYYWFAIPNAGKRSLRMGARMKREGMKAGVADLCIMGPRNWVGWMETKTAKGRQSDAQKGFQAICKRLDHPYVLVRSLDEGVYALELWGVLR